MAAATLRLLLTVVDPPPRSWTGWHDIEAGLQRGATAAGEVAPGARRPDGSIRLAGELRVGDGPAAAGGPSLLRGPCVFGPPAGRFLYVSWSGVADGGGCSGGRRCPWGRSAGT